MGEGQHPVIDGELKLLGDSRLAEVNEALVLAAA